MKSTRQKKGKFTFSKGCIGCKSVSTEIGTLSTSQFLYLYSAEQVRIQQDEEKNIYVRSGVGDRTQIKDIYEDNHLVSTFAEKVTDSFNNSGPLKFGWSMQGRLEMTKQMLPYNRCKYSNNGKKQSLLNN